MSKKVNKDDCINITKALAEENKPFFLRNEKITLGGWKGSYTNVSKNPVKTTDTSAGNPLVTEEEKNNSNSFK